MHLHQVFFLSGDFFLFLFMNSTRLIIEVLSTVLLSIVKSFLRFKFDDFVKKILPVFGLILPVDLFPVIPVPIVVMSPPIICHRFSRNRSLHRRPFIISLSVAFGHYTAGHLLLPFRSHLLHPSLHHRSFYFFPTCSKNTSLLKKR